jgi:hypothetical protein
MQARALFIVVIVLSVAAMAQSAPPGTSSPEPVSQLQPSHYDRGIYLPPGAGDAFCGTIVSYNFTRGDDPRLKNVTTCTPMTRHVPKRAQGQEPKPQPRLRYVADGPTGK